MIPYDLMSAVPATAGAAGMLGVSAHNFIKAGKRQHGLATTKPPRTRTTGNRHGLRQTLYCFLLPGYRKELKLRAIAQAELDQCPTLTPAYEKALGMPDDHTQVWPLWTPADGVNEVVMPELVRDIDVQKLHADVQKLHARMSVNGVPTQSTTLGNQYAAPLAPRKTTPAPPSASMGFITGEGSPDHTLVTGLRSIERSKGFAARVITYLAGEGCTVERYPEKYAENHSFLTKIRYPDGRLRCTMVQDSDGNIVNIDWGPSTQEIKSMGEGVIAYIVDGHVIPIPGTTPAF